MRRFLITGGAGSFGTAFAKKFGDDYDLCCYSRDPLKHDALKRIVPSVDAFVGSVTNRRRFAEILGYWRPDAVIHAAALKHVIAGEDNPLEYLMVNTIGSRVVAHCCGMAGVERVLLISTDKAVEPVNVYGLTKALAEAIWKEMARRYPHTKFIIIRLGNVLDARGSVLRRWIAAKKANKPLVARVPAPTRFVLSLDMAVNFAMEALKTGRSGDVLVPADLKAVDILDMAYAISSHVITVPLYPAEKQHEVLASWREGRERVGPFYRVFPDPESKNETPYSSRYAPLMDPRSVAFEMFRHLWEDEK